MPTRNLSEWQKLQTLLWQLVPRKHVNAIEQQVQRAISECVALRETRRRDDDSLNAANACPPLRRHARKPVAARKKSRK